MRHNHACAKYIVPLSLNKHLVFVDVSSGLVENNGMPLT